METHAVSKTFQTRRKALQLFGQSRKKIRKPL